MYDVDQPALGYVVEEGPEGVGDWLEIEGLIFPAVFPANNICINKNKIKYFMHLRIHEASNEIEV